MVPPQSPRALERTFTQGSWTFTAVTACISGQEDLMRIQQILLTPKSLPEMLFGSNSLMLRHNPSGAQVHYWSSVWRLATRIDCIHLHLQHFPSCLRMSCAVDKSVYACLQYVQTRILYCLPLEIKAPRGWLMHVDTFAIEACELLVLISYTCSNKLALKTPELSNVLHLPTLAIYWFRR
jgi:hypothetical protein